MIYRYLRKAIRTGVLWIFPILYGKNWWYKLRRNENLYGRLNRITDMPYNKLIKITIHKDHIIAFTHMGILTKNFINYDDLEIFKSNLREILLDEIYTAKLSINADDYVIDVGAHVGIFTLLASKRAKLVVALEPHPLNFKYLRANVKINDLRNVIPLNIAVSDYDGLDELHLAPISTEHTLTPDKARARYFVNSIKVPVRRIDTLVRELNIPDDAPLFVKVDVEGAELNVIRSALALKNPLKFSIAAYHYPNEVMDLIKILKENTFKADILRYGPDVYVYARKS